MTYNDKSNHKPAMHVLLAAFEGEDFLSEQIDSIVNQNAVSNVDVQIYIGSDPSSDKTRLIADNYEQSHKNIHHIAHSYPSGSAKRNFSRLMEMVLGSDAKYIALADQDDVWDEDKVAKSFEKMMDIERTIANNSPVLVFTDSRIVNEGLSQISGSFWQHEKIDPKACGNYKKLIFQNVGQGCTFVFNRQLLELAIPIPEEARMHDHWLMLVASVFGVISYVNEPTMSYRQHSKNVVGSGGHCFAQSMNRFFSKAHAIRESILASEEQADVFLRRYRDKMTDEQQRFFQEVSSLDGLPLFDRRIILLKNKINMSTLDRTIGLYLFS